MTSRLSFGLVALLSRGQSRRSAAALTHGGFGLQLARRSPGPAVPHVPPGDGSLCPFRSAVSSTSFILGCSPPVA